MSAPTMRIDSADFYMRNVRTRMPFKYGVAVLTSVPILHVILNVTVEGNRVQGIAADILPPKWFDKDPVKEYEDNVEDMLFCACAAARVYSAVGRSPNTFFSIWQEGYEATLAAGDTRHLNHLTAAHGSSLMERALIDACGRGLGRTYFQLIRDNTLDLDLGCLHAELAGVSPAVALTNAPLTSIAIRHTVGLADPIYRGDIPAEEVLDDGLPQALEEYISAQGIAFLKVKVSGDMDADRERLRAIAGLLDQRARSCQITLDGNEQYRDMDAFSMLLDYIDEELPTLWRRILYVEQPLERSVALNSSLREGIAAAGGRKPLLVDESDGDIDTFAQAMDLGYCGVSSKACKGLVKAIANAALAHTRDATRYFLTGEDLMNLPVVPLHQDLVHVAALGIRHVERNGHHYVRGLDHLSERERTACLLQHSDMYAYRDGLAALVIERGQVAIDSLQRPGLGVGLDTDVEGMVPLGDWSFAQLS